MKPSLDRRTLLASSAALAALAAAPGRAFAQAAMAGPPVAPVRPVTETIWGVPVTDPYRWMEEQSAEWKAYALAQGAYAKQVLDAIPGRDALYAAIDKNSGEITVVSGVQVGGPYIFIEMRPPDAETFKLYVREGRDGADRLLIDPDETAAAGSHNSLDWWSVVARRRPRGVRHLARRLGKLGAAHPGDRHRRAPAGDHRPHRERQSRLDRRRDRASSTTGCRTSPHDCLDQFKFSADWFHKLNTDPASDFKVFAAGVDPAVEIADIDFPIVETTPGSDIAFGALISGVQNEIAL